MKTHTEELKYIPKKYATAYILSVVVAFFLIIFIEILNASNPPVDPPPECVWKVEECPTYELMYRTRTRRPLERWTPWATTDSVVVRPGDYVAIAGKVEITDHGTQRKYIKASNGTLVATDQTADLRVTIDPRAVQIEEIYFRVRGIRESQTHRLSWTAYGFAEGQTFFNPGCEKSLAQICQIQIVMVLLLILNKL